MDTGFQIHHMHVLKARWGIATGQYISMGLVKLSEFFHLFDGSSSRPCWVFDLRPGLSFWNTGIRVAQWKKTPTCKRSLHVTLTDEGNN